LDNSQEAAYNGGTSEGDNPIEQGAEPTAESQQEAPTLQCPTRKRVATEKYLQYLEQQNPIFVAYRTIVYQSADIDPQDYIHPLEVFAATAGPNTMYLHKTMKQPEKAQFLKAMQEEVQAHTDNQLWELCPRRLVPQGTHIIPAVWSMKRKQHIQARLAFDGSKQFTESTFGEKMRQLQHGLQFVLFYLVH
jgi:hypothetical protein